MMAGVVTRLVQRRGCRLGGVGGGCDVESGQRGTRLGGILRLIRGCKACRCSGLAQFGMRAEPEAGDFRRAKQSEPAKGGET